MMRLWLTLFILFLIPSLAVHGQDLSRHQWQNRLLVMVADDPSFFEDQLLELGSCQSDFLERKVLIYQVLPDSFRVLSDQTGWTRASSLYQRFSSHDGGQTILLGLDGGVKLRKNRVVECNEINDLIDQMPMRKAEMQKN